MICTSIKGKSLREIYGILDSGTVEMAEIRLDSCRLDNDDIEELFSTTDTPLVATCRLKDSGITAKQAEEMLRLAVESGASFLDLDLDAPVQMSKRLSRLCRSEGTMVIRSYHDFRGTPPVEDMVGIIDKARRFGADIVKIAVTARGRADCDAVLSLYDTCPPGTLLAFCMGPEGRSSRLECLAKGAPFTYAALKEDETTAPGQWTVSEISTALYGGRRPFIRRDVQMPASKSFAQRAIIAAALADGESRLFGYTPCDDSEAALKVADALGAGISIKDNIITVKGIGFAKDAAPLDIDEVDTGESGLLTRLMIPIMALAGKGSFSVKGRGTLLSRPLPYAADIMASFGVILTNSEARKSREIMVPLHSEGRLLPGRAEIQGRGGSQIISGLLMALPLASADSTLYILDPKSIPYMFITQDMLRRFGISVSSEMEGGEDFLESQDWSCCTGINFHIPGGQAYRAADIELEADWSSAAALLAAGAVFGEVTLLGLDTKSLQADITMLDILADAGASVSEEEDGTVNVYKAPLNSFEVDLNNAPDLFPTVAVFAGFCPGESCISGLGRLSAKESDRAAAILEMLEALGIEAGRVGDDLLVSGMSWSARLASGRLLRGGSFSSRGDHRMVMALKLASLGASEPLVIDNVECVSKSFPGFLDIFGNI